MRRRLLTLVLAGVLAVVGIIAVLAYVNNANQRAVANLKSVRVLVAKISIPTGTNVVYALRNHQLGYERLPVGSLPSDPVYSLASHGDSSMVTSSPLGPGELLVQSMLVSKSQGSTPLAITPGKMAISVQVCLSADVAGYVQPGSDVAIYDTGGSVPSSPLQYSCTSHQPPSKGHVVTNVVLPSVTVLSVIPNPTPSGTGSTGSTPLSGTAGSASTSVTSQGLVVVTLLVAVNDAKNLINASNSGALTLALLTPSTNVNTTGSTSTP